MQGTITVDGHPKDQATFNRVSGYVEQVISKASEILMSCSADTMVHSANGMRYHHRQPLRHLLKSITLSHDAHLGH